MQSQHSPKMALSEYSQLIQYIVLSVRTNERRSEILISMKEFFRDTINSVRRFEQVNSIGQLLKVLEVRDLLSEDNVECLKNIALKLPNYKEVLQKISDYESKHMLRAYGNNYYTSTPQSKKEPENSFMPEKRLKIFHTIINEIGSYWRVLGRYLKILECDIQDIDEQNKTLHVKVTKLLEKYEAMADPQIWFFVLCDALERTQRKDLVRSIQGIITG